VKPYIYHNYDATYKLLQQLSKKCPSIAALSSIGTSAKGKTIWSLELSVNKHNTTIPSVGLVGSLQGKDIIGQELLLTFLEYLCVGYERKNRRVVNILFHTKVHVVPMLDVDGSSHAVENDCKGVMQPKDDLGRAFYFDASVKQKRDLSDKMSSVS